VAWLRRTWSGPFDVGHGLTWGDVLTLGEAGTLEDRLLPIEAALAHLPQVEATADGARKIAVGNPGAVLNSAEGEVWVEPALMEALELKIGEDLSLGERRLRIAEVLLSEPDRGAGFMNFAPRVMMNQADLPATQLVQPASRLNWRLAVMGEPGQVSDFVAWADVYVKQADVRGMRVETLEAGRPEMRQTLDRAEKFLHLVALLAALLSAVAVALAALTAPPAW
jgi:putative ABC transport system permease protein